ncbi:MAG: cytochrome c [Thiotrichales bacterium]|nr:MAG: cytochrome c [Thiotrichales bacterium]
MKLHKSKLIAALVGAGMCIAATGAAQAWYDGPHGRYYGPSYYGEHGPQAMKRDRQKLMRNHGHAMDELESVIEGRKRFDRLEATKLAREIEAGAGENMWRLYEPASVATTGSRTAAPIWGNFDTFKANANALKQTAGSLADELEKRPTATDYQEGVWVPPRSSGWGNLWGQRDGDMTHEAIAEYIRLGRICTVCHLNFRTSRYGRW